MKKEDRQIEWINYNGYCKGQKVFKIWCGGYDYALYLVLPNYLACKLNSYCTLRDAECGAERFLKRLQEVGKLDKKKPKTCDDCWLRRDFEHYIPAGYCADKCAKIYNALKD